MRCFMKIYYVYILASQHYGTLYVGVTNNLQRRVWEHKQHVNKSFTQKYEVHNLVFFETYSSILEAIRREKQLKKWKRTWKTRLIEDQNQEWNDLSSMLND